jgi:hypothetical protein
MKIVRREYTALRAVALTRLCHITAAHTALQNHHRHPHLVIGATPDPALINENSRF